MVGLRSKIWSFAVGAICAVGLASSASASLVFERELDLSGTGIGAQLTVLSLQANGTETGCVRWSGSADVDADCIDGFGTSYDGGDEKASQGGTVLVGLSGIRDARDFRVMFNPNDNEQITINDARVRFQLANGDVILDALISTVANDGYDGCTGITGDNAGTDGVCEFNDPDIGGTGSAGFLFRLDDAQALFLNLAGFFDDANNRIGMAASLSLAGSGNDVFYVANFTEADLEISKTCPEDNLECEVAPEDLDYIIDVTNLGPTGAASVVVTDTLPAGAIFNSAICVLDNGQDCDPNAVDDCTHLDGVVTCTIDFLDRPDDDTPENEDFADSAQIIINFDAADCGLSLTNNVSVTSTTVDPATPNNADACTTIIGTPPDADVAIEKTGPALVDDNSDFSYTLVVSNIDDVTDPTDPDDADDVVVVDTLPAGVSFVGATTDPDLGDVCSAVGQVITCNLGTIDAGTSVTITVTVHAEDLGEFENCATVSSANEDPDLTNNEDCATTTIQGSDISVTKTAAAGPFLVGSNMVYTVTVSNAGPADATNVTVADDLPAGTTYVSDSSEDCTHDAGDPGTVNCTFDSIASGANVQFTITITVPAEEVEFCNNVSAASDLDDPDETDNAFELCRNAVIAVADLSITKIDLQDPVQIGSNVVYTISVHNDGPQTSEDVFIEDVLPESFTFVSATPSQGSCDEEAGTITCGLGDIANGATVTISVVAVATEIGEEFVNEACIIRSATSDPDDEDWCDSESTAVRELRQVPTASEWSLLLMAALLAGAALIRMRS